MDVAAGRPGWQGSCSSKRRYWGEVRTGRQTHPLSARERTTSRVRAGWFRPDGAGPGYRRHRCLSAATRGTGRTQVGAPLGSKWMIAEQRRVGKPASSGGPGGAVGSRDATISCRPVASGQAVAARLRGPAARPKRSDAPFREAAMSNHQINNPDPRTRHWLPQTAGTGTLFRRRRSRGQQVGTDTVHDLSPLRLRLPSRATSSRSASTWCRTTASTSRP